MNPEVARAIAEFRSRLGIVYLLKYLLATLAAWAFLYGTTVLVLRGGLGFSRLDALWGLLSLLPALGLAAYLTYRRLPSEESVRIVLDQHGRCGGLLMADAGESWNSALPELPQPQLRWHSGKSWLMLCGGAIFLTLAFAVPQGFANIQPRLDISREAEQLEKQLTVLEKEKLLEKQRAAELKEQLEKVRSDAKGKDPVKTLEALDQLQEIAQKTAKQANESTIRKMEDLARAETLTETLEKIGGKLDPIALGEAMKQLAELAKKADEERDVMDALDKDLMKALESGSKLTKEQLKKLKEALKDAKTGKLDKMAKLMKAKLIKAEDLKKCEEAGKCDCAALAAFLKENGANDKLSDEVALSEDPGNGGVNRGPGAAKLTFGEEAEENGFKFKEEELPESKLESLKNSTLAGVSSGDPKDSKEKAVSGATGALNGAATGGGSAGTQTILPKHRGAVERYFERGKK
jgi:hypothetical protein